MVGKYPGLAPVGETYYVRVWVPEGLRGVVGKRELKESLRTSDLEEARRLYGPVHARMKREIADARQSRKSKAQPEFDRSKARWALAAWGLQQQHMPPEQDSSLQTPWSVLDRVGRLKRAAIEPSGWREIDGFDQMVADMLSAGGMPVRVTDPVVAGMRQEAAMAAMLAAQDRERKRMTAAFAAASEEARTTPLLKVAAMPAKAPEERPTPTLTLRKLYDEWLPRVAPAEKEKGRLDHQIKRLIETVGDIPCNWLTKEQITEFMGLVSRFPGRKRPAELNALPMRELVELFEEQQEERDEGERWKTLTETTAGEWFASYRRMFDFAVANSWCEVNPWTPLRKFVVKGAESIRRRAFSEAEITTLFEKPLFQGEGSGAAFWLPILAYHHGCRMSELAALPLVNVKTQGEHWYFDTTADVKVKNEGSERTIPLHPSMKKLGFLDYVEQQREAGGTWLFPELDHDHRFGPGHEYSKAFGRWLRDDAGFADPSLVFHSFRHSWKRRARASPVKEEVHDVLSGHKSSTSTEEFRVSRKYGEGVDVAPLAAAMAEITFPAFPRVKAGGVGRRPSPPPEPKRGNLKPSATRSAATTA